MRLAYHHRRKLYLVELQLSIINQFVTLHPSIPFDSTIDCVCIYYIHRLLYLFFAHEPCSYPYPFPYPYPYSSLCHHIFYIFEYLLYIYIYSINIQRILCYFVQFTQAPYPLYHHGYFKSIEKCTILLVFRSFICHNIHVFTFTFNFNKRWN